MLSRFYAVVMDPKHNAFSHLPKIVTFQVMTVLAWMWSLVFSVWVGSLVVFGPTLGVHMLLLMGVLFTADVFARSRKHGLAA